MSTSSLVCHNSSTFLQKNESRSLFKSGLIYTLVQQPSQPLTPHQGIASIGKSKYRETYCSQVVSRNFDKYGNNLPQLAQEQIDEDHRETVINCQNIEKYETDKKEINGELTNILSGVDLTVISTRSRSTVNADKAIKGDDDTFSYRLNGIACGSSSGNEVLECNSKLTFNKQKTHSKRHKKLKEGKKWRKQHKESMKNKVSSLDLPSVTKATVNKKTSGNKVADVSISLGASCTAIKIHQNNQQTRYYHHAPGKIVKNEECYKTVSLYKTLPVHTNSKPCHSASLLVTCKKNTSSNRNVSSGDASNTSIRSSSPRISLNRRSVSQATNNYINRITKIYQSQAQSGTVAVCGVDIPCAPPATPTSEQLKTHQYVPSLNDIMAQRAVKMRLEKMEKKEQKKIDKKREDELKQEKIILKDKLAEKKKTQRLEIYALNKVMTELENKKFKEFCEAKGVS